MLYKLILNYFWTVHAHTHMFMPVFSNVVKDTKDKDRWKDRNPN